MPAITFPQTGSSDPNQRLQALEEFQRATFNILEDLEAERRNSQLIQKAAVNLLEDMYEEQRKLTDTQRALMNMLEDIELERTEVKACKNRSSRQ
jgi:hypothetical protein